MTTAWTALLTLVLSCALFQMSMKIIKLWTHGMGCVPHNKLKAKTESWLF